MTSHDYSYESTCDSLPHSCIRNHMQAVSQYLICILLRLPFYVRPGAGPCAQCSEENCSEWPHLQQTQFLGNSCIFHIPTPYKTPLDGGTHTLLIDKKVLWELNKPHRLCDPETPSEITTGQQDTPQVAVPPTCQQHPCLLRVLRGQEKTPQGLQAWLWPQQSEELWMCRSGDKGYLCIRKGLQQKARWLASPGF